VRGTDVDNHGVLVRPTHHDLAPAGLLIRWRSGVVTRTVAQEAIPRGRLPAWLVTDARAELMTQIRRLAREPRSRGSRNVALWPVRLWGSDLQDLHSYSLL